MDNTEGFTQQELDRLDSALVNLLDMADASITNKDAVKYYSDKLNNAFIRGECDTVEKLVNAVRNQ
jgi:uncharacterized protein (UPF0216 family)